jgi:lia operon protein LiaG
MNRNSRVILGVVAVVIGVSLIFSNFSLFGNNFDDSDSISLKGINEIHISGSSEAIKIIKSNQDGLNAELSGKSTGLGFTKPKVKVKKSGGKVSVEVKRSIFQLFSSSKLELTVFINDGYHEDLSLDLSSGDLVIDDQFDIQQLDIDISSGDMTIEDIRSEEATIDVSSGSLTIHNFTGDIDGEISSGDIEIEYTSFDNDISFDASSGSVEITLPSNSDFDLDGHRSSGSIKVDFDLTDYEKDNDNISGTAGNGGNQIDLDVSSGSISIEEK